MCLSISPRWCATRPPTCTCSVLISGEICLFMQANDNIKNRWLVQGFSISYVNLMEHATFAPSGGHLPSLYLPVSLLIAVCVISEQKCPVRIASFLTRVQVLPKVIGHLTRQSRKVIVTLAYGTACQITFIRVALRLELRKAPFSTGQRQEPLVVRNEPQ